MRQELLESIRTGKPACCNLSALNIQNEEIAEIFNTLQKILPDVQKIFLSKNEISDSGAIAIGKMSSFLPHLQFIDLQFNQIDIEGASALCAIKKTHPHFTFALHGNKIHDTGEMFAINQITPYR